MTYDSIINRGDYLSAHYLAEVLPRELRKDGLVARWNEREKAKQPTPRSRLKALRRTYTDERRGLADYQESLPDDPDAADPAARLTYIKTLHELHGETLRALGFAAEPRELEIKHGDRPYKVKVAHAEPTVIAIECGWAADVDAALDPDQAGLLLDPVELDNRERLTTGIKLASWLLTADEPFRPRYVLLLMGGVVVLADGAAWGEGRYLAVSLDVALERNHDRELETIAALFSADALRPPAEGGTEPLARLIEGSRRHTVGVSTELREGLRQSVEIIANEVLARLAEAGVSPGQIMEPPEFAKQLGREALRYLYRILFLLYAEARPELGVLPADHPEYVQGYGLQRLGELCVRDLIGEDARTGFHLYESLDLLFEKVNKGYPEDGALRAVHRASGSEGIIFEPLRADLFEPQRTRLIGRSSIVHPDYDEDDPNSVRIDTRLRNEALYKVLRLLMLTKGKRKERGGFISYAQLGINQLGAVYEGLMSYTGFIAEEELYEVAKNGDASGGSWMIPASKVPEYPESVFVRHEDEDGHKTEEFRRYRKGAFVYRLAGRDRQTSASYYTPESLTQVTVELALKERLKQTEGKITSREILQWTICEPALGSGAFLNEAINQVAAEYLKRRQEELRREGKDADLDPEEYNNELQKIKAYIALHNCYGVDLNETAVELAEVSLWLNVMYPGLQAPWFGLHLRRGNSLIGAGRRLYSPEKLAKKAWLKTTPEDYPLTVEKIPEGYIHHFLLPAEGWGAGEKGTKEFYPEGQARLAAWRNKIRTAPSKVKKGKPRLSQIDRLQGLARRVEFLWSLVRHRLEQSEKEIRRQIDVWGADWIEHPEQAIPKEKILKDLVEEGTPYWRLKMVMDAWCALWFWPPDKVALLDGTDDSYQRLSRPVSEIPLASDAQPAAESEPAGEPVTYEVDSIFGDGTKRFTVAPRSATKPKQDEQEQRPRSVIPLASLDDWLDFAEAVLGRQEVKGLAEFDDDLEKLREYEQKLPGEYFMNMDEPLVLANRFPWLTTLVEIVEREGFFHWELQFAQVFQKGGFDLQVGNPPWYRPRWEEPDVLAEFEPWFRLTEKASKTFKEQRRAKVLESPATRAYALAERTRISAMVAFFRSEATYPLLVGTQPDLYRCFMMQTWAHATPKGIVGLLHPDSHFTGDKEALLREAAYQRLRVHGDFVNPGHRFFPEPVGESSHFGVHVYGPAGEIGFDHLCWLFSVDALRSSFDHDGSGDPPGVRYQGKLDERPHRTRIIRVNREVLAQWQRLTGEQGQPVEQARLLSPVSTAEADAIKALADYPVRLGQFNPQFSRGFEESGAKDEGLIDYNLSQPGDWSEVILKGIQIGPATPLFKPPNAGSNDVLGVNLVTLPESAVPETEYRRVTDLSTYRRAQDRWIDHQTLAQLLNDPDEMVNARAEVADSLGISEHRVTEGQVRDHLAVKSLRRYTEFYRLAWRRQIAPDTERSLYAALVPPGVAHVDLVHSAVLADASATALAAGFWSALPVDYFVRITGKGDLRVNSARSLPFGSIGHPLASPLLLRTLRLNCLTSAYADLWADVYQEAWRNERWACAWKDLDPIGSVGPSWGYETPLRSERARRAALVEIDALVAVWLGMDVEALIAAYRARFPVMNRFEESIWFDANGWKLAGNHRTHGQIQTKDSYKQLLAYHANPENTAPPEGYEPPFYKADREGEYRQAHAVFSERMQ